MEEEEMGYGWNELLKELCQPNTKKRHRSNAQTNPFYPLVNKHLDVDDYYKKKTYGPKWRPGQIRPLSSLKARQVTYKRKVKLPLKKKQRK